MSACPNLSNFRFFSRCNSRQLRRRLLGVVAGTLLGGLWLPAQQPAPAPFPAPAISAQQHPYDLQHVELDVQPNFAQRSLRVVESLTFDSRVPALRALSLDSDGPRIDSISDHDGTRLQFQVQPGKLGIRLEHPLPVGARDTLVIRYHVVPRGGAVFFPGDIQRPDQATYLWVSGEPNTNHLWLPIYDHPNDKLTADFRITAPKGDWVIANGRLVGTRSLPDGERQFHWSQDIPISSYLLTFYIGRWTRVEADAQGTPLEYVTSPDETAADARARFGRTPAMIAFYTAKLGVPYPWAKYAEVRNPGFFASLENASATEFPGDFPSNADVPNILDAYRAEDITLSHELAHQWFGDLVTCLDWSDLWVNEGMATFMQHQWDQQANGQDKAISGWEDAADQYFRAEGDPGHPLVRPDYKDAWNMFDVTTYNKGSWAVRTLEGQIGSKALWRGLHLYLTRYRAGNGDTARFEKAMEDASGKNLHAFFQQWFYTPGHPVFDASSRWNEKTHADNIQLVQKNRHLYTGTIQVAAWVNGRRHDLTLTLTGKSQTLAFPLPAPPQLVQIDPDHLWLKQLDWKHRSVAEWTYAATHASWSVDREQALRELDLVLAAHHKPELARLLVASVEKDPSADVRNAALSELAGIDPAAARSWALRFLKAENTDTRQTGAGVLAELPASPGTVPPLEAIFRRDPISAVRAEALKALLQQNPSGSTEYLAEALKMKSFNWQVESTALSALAEKGAASLPTLLAWSTPSTPAPAREAALRGLGRVGKGSQPAIQSLRTALNGPLGPSQILAALSLARLGDKASLPEIEHLRDTCWIGFFRSGFTAAAQQLQHK